MSLATQYAASQDTTFQTLIQAAIVQQAIAITGELTTVTNHANRVRLATSVLLSPSAYVSDFAQAVASQAVDKTATDALILTTVSAVWNALAGVI
jgi:hypothetical protein